MSRLPIFLTILDKHVLLPARDLGRRRNEFDFRHEYNLTLFVYGTARTLASISGRRERDEVGTTETSVCGDGLPDGQQDQSTTQPEAITRGIVGFMHSFRGVRGLPADRLRFTHRERKVASAGKHCERKIPKKNRHDGSSALHRAESRSVRGGFMENGFNECEFRFFQSRTVQTCVTAHDGNQAGDRTMTKSGLLNCFQDRIANCRKWRGGQLRRRQRICVVGKLSILRRLTADAPDRQ